MTPILEEETAVQRHMQVSRLTATKMWGWDTSQDLVPHSDTRRHVLGSALHARRVRVSA